MLGTWQIPNGCWSVYHPRLNRWEHEERNKGLLDLGLKRYCLLIALAQIKGVMEARILTGVLDAGLVSDLNF